MSTRIEHINLIFSIEENERKRNFLVMCKCHKYSSSPLYVQFHVLYVLQILLKTVSPQSKSLSYAHVYQLWKQMKFLESQHAFTLHPSVPYMTTPTVGQDSQLEWIISCCKLYPHPGRHWNQKYTREEIEEIRYIECVTSGHWELLRGVMVV